MRPYAIRHAEPDDHARVVAVVDDWWGGRPMAAMLPRLFFVHFRDTSFVAVAREAAAKPPPPSLPGSVEPTPSAREPAAKPPPPSLPGSVEPTPSAREPAAKPPPPSLPGSVEPTPGSGEGTIAGFLCGFRSQTYADEAYVHFVGVDPALRGQGIARSLYERFFEAIAPRHVVRCVTSPVNEASVAFHRSIGFEVERVAEDYDGRGGDRVLFVKKLP